MLRYPVAALLCTLLLAGCSDAEPAWRELPPAPEARTEVVGAPLSGRVAVIGGLTADGRASARVDLYDPRRERWLRLPDLPEGLHHAMAASRAGRLYVVGGYRIRAGQWEATDRAWVLFDRRWRAAAAAARAARGGRRGDRAQPHLRRRRDDGPGGGQPRGRLAPARPAHAALAGLSRACPGRASTWASPPSAAGSTRSAAAPTGLETNTAAADAYDPRARRWSRLPDAPTRRGGNGATAVGGQSSPSAGRARTAPSGRSTPSTRHGGTWRSLPRSPRPRHGVAVVGIGRTLYQGLGGPEPGLIVSPTLLSLRVPAPRVRNGEQAIVASSRAASTWKRVVEVERRARAARRPRAPPPAGRPRAPRAGRRRCRSARPQPSPAMASARPAAVWHSDSASDPSARRRRDAPVEVADGVADARRRGALQHQQLEALARLGAGVERRAVEPRARGPARRRTPRRCRGRAPGRAHTSAIVRPSATAAAVAKAGMPRLALRLPSIGSSTTTGGPPPARSRSPSSSLISVSGRPRASSSASTASSAMRSTRSVTSPPAPRPSGSARSSGGQRAQLGVDAVAGAPERAEPGAVRRRARPAQPSTSEWKATPVSSFGKK